MEANVPFSDKPWSSFSESDYTPEQWKAACLIHLSDSLAKDQHKLPVKEPGGPYNRNGIHSAAVALAGGRTPLKASPEKKRAAARKVISLYRQMDETAPESTYRIAGERRPEKAAGK